MGCYFSFCPPPSRPPHWLLLISQTMLLIYIPCHVCLFLSSHFSRPGKALSLAQNKLCGLLEDLRPSQWSSKSNYIHNNTKTLFIHFFFYCVNITIDSTKARIFKTAGILASIKTLIPTVLVFIVFFPAIPVEKKTKQNTN